MTSEQITGSTSRFKSVIADGTLELLEIANGETLFYNCSSALEQDPGLAVQRLQLPLFGCGVSAGF